MKTLKEVYKCQTEGINVVKFICHNSIFGAMLSSFDSQKEIESYSEFRSKTKLKKIPKSKWKTLNIINKDGIEMSLDNAIYVYELGEVICQIEKK